MSADIEQPVTEDPAAPPAAAEETTTDPPESVAERDVDADTLEIPDSSAEGGKARYVREETSAIIGLKHELKETKQALAAAKEGSAKAAQLEQSVAQLQAQIQQLTPYVQAYQAALTQPQPVEEDDTEAVELARTLDLYKPDGTPDVDKAKKTLALMDKRAGQRVQQEVAPIHQQTTAQRAHYNLQRALNTEVNGMKPDPAITRALWARLPADVTANEEQAKHLVIQALGMTVMQGKAASATRGANGQFTKPTTEEIPPPLHVEKAGGRDTAPAMAMSDAEKRLAKEIGLSEKEYLDRAKNMPGYGR